MIRYVDKLLAAAGAILVVTLVGAQVYSVGTMRIKVAAALDEARKLVKTADANVTENPTFDSSTRAGRVFSAWETMPTTEPLATADFFPPAPTPAGRPGR
jgi:hypothetical protein